MQGPRQFPETHLWIFFILSDYKSLTTRLFQSYLRYGDLIFFYE